MTDVAIVATARILASRATKLLADNGTVDGNITPPDILGLAQAADFSFIGQPGGAAALDGSGRVPAAQSSVPTPVTTVAASGAAQNLAFPASGSAAYDITLTANCAISLAGGTAGQLQTLTLILRQDATAGHLPSLPGGVKWAGGTAPVPNTAAGGIDVFTFTTPDARATVLGGY